MKTILTLAMAVLAVGCMRRSDEQIRISVLDADRYELRNRELDDKSLRADLLSYAQRFGPSTPVVFIFAPGSTYGVAEKPLHIAAAIGFWHMALAQGQTEKGEQFFRHPGDGPPMIDVFLDVKGTNVLRDGTSCDLARDIDLRDRPKGIFGHRVWISPDSDAPISLLITLLRECNRIETVTPFVGHFKELEIDISNQASQAIGAPGAPQPER